jgi:hypothetical protein
VRADVEERGGYRLKAFISGRTETRRRYPLVLSPAWHCPFYVLKQTLTLEPCLGFHQELEKPEIEASSKGASTALEMLFGNRGTSPVSNPKSLSMDK